MGKVLIQVEVTLTDQVAGTQVWVDDSPRVAGMVAGGYWRVVTRQGPAPTSAKRAKTPPPPAVVVPVEEESDGVEDPA